MKNIVLTSLAAGELASAALGLAGTGEHGGERVTQVVNTRVPKPRRLADRRPIHLEFDAVTAKAAGE